MSLKNQWVLNFALVVISWLSLPFLGSRNIKRFLPATILITLIEFLDVGFGKKRKWWFFYNKPNSYFFGEFPFNIGPFFVSSMWILKWTYGNFKRYLLLNAIVNAIFAFPIESFSRKLKYYTLVRLSKFGFFLFFFYKAVLLYGFQYLFEIRKDLTKSTIYREKYVEDNILLDIKESLEKHPI